jgi:hypothetical protein
VSRAIVTIAAAVTLATTFLASPAEARVGAPRVTTPGAAAACKGAAVKPKIHDAALRREGTLDDLVARLQARSDPWHLNAGQISTLQSAKSGITALDAEIASTCYPTLAALHTDAEQLIDNYRVYVLRVPQTRGIEAADYLAEASGRLSKVATKLEQYVGSNAAAQSDLAAMKAAIVAGNGQIGTPPQPAPPIAALPGLQPAKDTTTIISGLSAARATLVAARSSFQAARADGKKVIADLGG